MGYPAMAWVQPADTLYQEAQQAFQERQFDEAYQTYEKAGVAFFENQQWIPYLRCRIEMARCSQFTSIVSRQAIKEIVAPAMEVIHTNPLIKQSGEAVECYQFLARHQWAIEGDYDAAILSYEESLNICDLLGDTARHYRMSTLADLSHVYSNKEQFDQALLYALEALNISQTIYGENHVENGPRYYNLGFTYYRKGHFDQAIREIRKGIQILEENQGPEMQIGLGYNNLAAVYVAKLDQEGAFESSQAAEQILTKYLGPGHEAIANIYWDLGAMYIDLELYDLAEENLQKANTIFNTNFGPSYPQLPQLYHQLGFCHDRTGQYARGEKWHLQAYELNLSTYGPLHPRTGESYRQLASHYNLAGNIEKAGWAINEGLEVIQSPGNQSDMLRAWIYDEQGNMLSLQHQYMESAASFEEAVKAICFSSDNGIHVSADETFNPLYFTVFKSKKTKALFLASRQKEDPEILKLALTEAQAAHDGIRRLRYSYQNAESRLFLQKRARKHYDLMLEILFELWQKSGDESYLSQAWQISEQTKSLLLLEAIKATDLKFSGIPGELLDTLKNLRQDLSFHQQNILELQTEGDTVGLFHQQTNFFRIKNKLSVFENQLAERYPEYESLQLELAPISIREIASRLLSDNTVIEYYLADSILYLFTISNQAIHWERTLLPPDFKELMHSFNNECRNLEKILRNPQEALRDFHRQSTQLSSFLFSTSLSERLESVENLTIIPDQELGYISFEALTHPVTKDYLIERYVIHYAYSASLYHLELLTKDKMSLDYFAGFAPGYSFPASNSDATDMAMAELYRAGPYDLPGAQQEVREISKLFKGKTWLGEDATEEVFKAEASNYSILHLALHGLIDEKNPMLSRLLFHQRDSSKNGALNAYEIYNLDLNANLAVLSACNTAAGSLRSGEGILSLSRAFAFAGIPNLIASLWRADDDASAKIMIDFYEGLTKGLTKGRALRQAKLEFIRDQKSETYQHPYFWSSFILIGENNSTFTASSYLLWWIGGITIVFLLVVLGQKYRFNR